MNIINYIITFILIIISYIIGRAVERLDNMTPEEKYKKFSQVKKELKFRK